MRRHIIIYLLAMTLGGLSPALEARASGDSEEMVLIPAGPFIMGSRQSLVELNPVDLLNTDRHALGPEDPAHETILDDYYIDRFEVTNGDYMKFVEVSGAAKPRTHDNPDFNDPRQPVAGVNWKEANAYCQWRGKRLPSEAEWEKAGRGKRPVKYPWGNEAPESSRLNYNEELNKTAPVGSYEAGKSDYGVHDLSGNVAEWTNDWHLPEYYLFSPKENPPGPEKGQYKVLRGGNWRNNADDVRLTYRNATIPSLRNLGVGFRCAKSAG
jgi:formylglycine-generating enzyme required for sulfatase activity